MRTISTILLATLLAATLPGCCCLDRCRPGVRVFGKPTAQLVQPPSNWCWGNCLVGTEAHETPAYVAPIEGVPGSAWSGVYNVPYERS